MRKNMQRFAFALLLAIFTSLMGVSVSSVVQAQNSKACTSPNFESQPDYKLDFSKITTETLSQYLRIQDGQDFDNWAAKWNSEKQLYSTSPDNVRVENNQLVIQGLVQEKTDHDQLFHITSARVDLIGIWSAMYGCFTTRAKIAEGAGSWSAFWMLPEGGAQDLFPLMTAEEAASDKRWQAGGELDVFESLGSDVRPEYAPGTGVLSSAVHTFSSILNQQHNSHVVHVENLYGGLHDFTLQWLPDQVTFLIDDTVIYQVDNTSLDLDWRLWPFGVINGKDRPFYPIWNLAFGGGWNDGILERQGRSFPDGVDTSQADKWIYVIDGFEHYGFVPQ